MAKKKVIKKKKTPTRRNTMFGRKRIAELEKQHAAFRDDMRKTSEDYVRKHNIQIEDLNREISRLKEVEATLEKKFNEQKALAFKTMELEFKGKMQDEVNRVRNEAQDKVQKGIEENFAKLKDSLAKLHEEGNAQTKFTEQIALKMMDTIRPNIPQLKE